MTATCLVAPVKLDRLPSVSVVRASAGARFRMNDGETTIRKRCRTCTAGAV